MYKIIFSDIDGTLLSGLRTLSQATITEVKRLKGKLPFVLVSSRMPLTKRFRYNRFTSYSL